METSSLREGLRKRAWDYFQMHASQRLTTFNFYIVLSTLIAAGLFSTFEGNFDEPLVGCVLGALLSLFSFVFWKLDDRNRELIKTAESALKFLEDVSGLEDPTGSPHALKVFRSEEAATNTLKRRRERWPWKKHMSYSDCFRFVFLVFGLGGLSAAAYLAYWCAVRS